MDHLSDMEKKLVRLVPPALSEGGQRSLEQMIDDLAGVEVDSAVGYRRKFLKLVATVAVLAVPAGVFLFGGFSEETEETLAMAEVGDFLEMELLTSIKRVDAQEDDGLIVPSNGAVPHYRYRYRVIDEEVVRDPQSGEVITLRQPRQEVVTIPVTYF
jgi:hypothetical protein